MIAILLSSLALAQSPEQAENQEIIYAKKTLVDFVGANVDATTGKPQITFISEWKPHHEGSLIRLRQSFTVEMNQSVDDVK